MKIKGISIKNLAIYISDYLRKNGVDTVLSGGACVTIYTNNKFISLDLDFVLRSSIDSKKIEYLLEKIGFQAKGMYFEHEDTEYSVQILPPPPSVGAEPVKKIDSIRKGNMVLKLLSPTDSVKDRLAAYYHWNDKQSLDQAISIYRDNSIDLKEVERWSNNEGMENKFEIFKRHLKKE